MGRRNDGIYPARKYRRAWIVVEGGDPQRFNGVWTYYGHSKRVAGEVFFVRKDAESVVKHKLKYAHGDVDIIPVLVPSQIGPSEHVRAMRALHRGDQAPDPTTAPLP